MFLKWSGSKFNIFITVLYLFFFYMSVGVLSSNNLPAVGCHPEVYLGYYYNLAVPIFTQFIYFFSHICAIRLQFAFACCQVGAIPSLRVPNFVIRFSSPQWIAINKWHKKLNCELHSRQLNCVMFSSSNTFLFSFFL